MTAPQEERDYRPLRELARQLLTQEANEPVKVPEIRPFHVPVPAEAAPVPATGSKPIPSEAHDRRASIGGPFTPPAPVAPQPERLPEKETVAAVPEPAIATETAPAPEIRKLRGLKTIEIKKAMAHIQGGILRPPFRVPPAPSRVNSLEEALGFARQLLPLPQEMQLAQKPAHRSWLLAQIRRCSTQKSLSDFAFSLNYKDLASLFPALATLKRGEEMDRLISIIMMRASRYLYIQGWMTLQYAYPRSTVQRGLQEVCRLLEAQPAALHESLNPDELAWFDKLHLGETRFDWNALPLISEISLPNTRHFMGAIVRYIRESGSSGEAFFRRYGIYRDLPLGQAIQSEWDMVMFEGSVNREHFPVRRLFQRDEL